MVTPDYYKKFRCIGGECKNSCCRGGWEIEIDDKTLERYNKISGKFGEKVRESINEDNCFKGCGGQCSLFTKDGLCELVLNGEPLCVTCDEFPRFTEYFDDYSERGISLSCETAAEIILSQKNRINLVNDDNSACDEPFFKFLYDARSKIFNILYDRKNDIFKRVRLMLDYTYNLQERINNNDFSDFEYTPRDTKSGNKSIGSVIDFLKSLTILNPVWRDILDNAYKNQSNVHNIDDVYGEQLAVYFVYRYFLKAFFDYDTLSKIKFAALSFITIIAIENSGVNLLDSARLYSTEIEHNDENIELIIDEFLFNEDFSYECLVNMI